MVMTPATMLARAAASATAAAPLSLTTVFSAPSSCYGLYLQTGWFSLGGPEASSISNCFPSGWATGTTQYFTGTTPECPQNYEIVTSSIYSIGTVTATTGTCCPSDWLPYTYTDGGFFPGQRCTSDYFQDANVTVTSKAANGIGYVTTTRSVSSNDGINAYGIAMNWQIAAATSSSSTTSSSATSPPTSTSAQSTSAAPTATSTADPKSSGLSTGAKAGIGIGCAVGALLLLGLLAAFLLRRRRRNREGAAATAPHPGHGNYVEGMSEMGDINKSPGTQSAHAAAYGGPPEGTYGHNGQYTPVPQTATSPQSEMSAQPHYGGYGDGTHQQPHQPHELAGGHEMHELDGGNTPVHTGNYA